MKILLRFLLAGIVVTLAAGAGLSQVTSVISSEWVIINGHRWALYKVISGGKETHLFRGPGGETLTLQEIAARFPAPAVDPELSAKVSRLAPTAPVRVIVILRHQPVEAIAEQADRALAARVKVLRTQAEAVMLRSRLAGARVNTADARTLRQVGLQWKQLRRARNAQILQEASRRTAAEQASLVGYIQSLGGRGRGGFRMVNMAAGVVPARAVGALAAHPLVAHVAEDVRAERQLDVSIPSIGADTIWANGFIGGTWDVSVIDSGMDATHPAFAGKTISSLVCHGGGMTDPSYIDNPATSDDLQGHGTHVGGIVMSQGAAECPGCRGVARGLDITYNLKAAWLNSSGTATIYNSDMFACVDAAGIGPEVHNLSYGSLTFFDYPAAAQWIDGAIRNFAFDFTAAAGNDGPSGTTINSYGTAYNIMSVASMNDQNTTVRSDDRISSFSSRGPTVGGRRKPDLAAPGHGINSARHNWESLSDFVNFNGTSMAAPHVTGAFILLWDVGLWSGPTHARKALLINSADAWSDNGTPSDGSDDFPTVGSVWNATYGWGYMNLANAFNQRFNVFFGSVTAADPDDNGFVVGDMSINQKATLVWEKRNVYAGTSFPTTLHALTDVDLFMYRESDNVLRASSLSGINNVEQVAAPASERVVLKADVFSGSIAGATSEGISIAAQGSNFEAAARGPTIRMTSTPVVCPGASFTARAQMRHWGNIVSHNNSATLLVPAGFTLTAGANPQNFPTIAAGSRGTATWTISAPASGSGVFGNTGGVSSYGETWSIVHNLNVAVQNPSFSDVPCSHAFYGFIQRILTTMVTSGCGGGLYCPDAEVTRRSMAAFIIRAMGESPAACTGVFSDVPPGSQFCGHIERMAQLSITSGCTATTYCPDLPVTRGQMAKFIRRARAIADPRWAEWNKSSPTFADVPASYPHYADIERLALEQITDGCTMTTYCPDISISRGQMAVFLARAFPSQW